MDFVRPLSELPQVGDELRIEMHYWLQVYLPKLFSDVVIETDVLVSNKIEFIELDIHAEVYIPVILELVFQFWDKFEEIFRVVDTT